MARHGCPMRATAGPDLVVVPRGCFAAQVFRGGINRQNNQTCEAIVDLTKDSVVSFEHIPDVTAGRSWPSTQCRSGSSPPASSTRIPSRCSARTEGRRRHLPHPTDRNPALPRRAEWPRRMSLPKGGDGPSAMRQSMIRTGVSLRSVSPRKYAGSIARHHSMNTSPKRIRPRPRISTNPTPKMLAPLP